MSFLIGVTDGWFCLNWFKKFLKRYKEKFQVVNNCLFIFNSDEFFY